MPDSASLKGALLFDLDGTLVDSDALHLEAFNRVMARYGQSVDHARYMKDIQGHPNSAILESLFPGAGADHAHVADEKEALFRSMLEDDVAPIAGINAVLDWAGAHSFGVAVVTNAPRENAEAMLRASGLAGRFAVVVIGHELPRPKPDPLPYQTAMQQLGVTPSRSVAFEDSRAGMRAAHGSGAYSFGITSGLDDATLRQAGARQTIADYTAPALWQHLETLVEATT